MGIISSCSRHLPQAALAVALVGSTLASTGAMAASAPHKVMRSVPARQIVAWAPSALGTIAVRRGQSVVKTVEFTNLYPVADLHVSSTLSGDADGLSIRILGTTIPVSRRVNHDFRVITVRFAISASNSANLGLFAANLHIDARLRGSNVYHQVPSALSFKVRVERAIRVQPAPTLISWSPDTLGTVTLQQGQAITETASFTSNADLYGARLRSAISNFGAYEGLHVHLISSGIQAYHIMANTATPVTFSVTAGRYARRGTYTVWLSVSGSLSRGFSYATLPHPLTLRVVVTAAPPTATSTPAPTGTATSTAVPTATSTTVPTATSTTVPTATSTTVPTATSTTVPTATSTTVPTATSTATLATATGLPSVTATATH